MRAQALLKGGQNRIDSRVRESVFPTGLHRKAASLLDRLLNTATLQDCYNYPPGWRFKELHGKLRGTYQVRLDDKYRIRFRWDTMHGAVAITVGEFHGDDG